LYNLRETILAEHSKEQKDAIVQWIGKSQKRFDELFELFLHDEHRVVQRTAWALSDCVIKQPSFIQKHFAALIKKMKEPKVHNAVKRNALRILQHLEIAEEYHGEIMDLSFQYISSPNEPVAIKAFALTVLQNLAKIYPEIISEVKLIIEERLPHETAAFRSRARQFGNLKI
jgi:hypothetical protein